jgi:hypothetical protein
MLACLPDPGNHLRELPEVARSLPRVQLALLELELLRQDVLAVTLGVAFVLEGFNFLQGGLEATGLGFQDQADDFVCGDIRTHIVFNLSWARPIGNFQNNNFVRFSGFDSTTPGRNFRIRQLTIFFLTDISAT